jgi:hypothetical protein
MTFIPNLNPNNRLGCDERAQFEKWIGLNRELAAKTPLRILLQQYGPHLSNSAAYRVALRSGLRGNRRNSSRYAEFWATIDWTLPDTILERIWGVARQNLRHRRVRIGAGDPHHSARGPVWSDALQTAIRHELNREKHFHGPRPR